MDNDKREETENNNKKSLLLVSYELDADLTSEKTKLYMQAVVASLILVNLGRLVCEPSYL